MYVRIVINIIFVELLFWFVITRGRNHRHRLYKILDLNLEYCPVVIKCEYCCVGQNWVILQVVTLNRALLFEKYCIIHVSFILAKLFGSSHIICGSSVQCT